MIVIAMAIGFAVALAVALKKPAESHNLTAEGLASAHGVRGANVAARHVGDVTDPAQFPHSWPVGGPSWLPIARPLADTQAQALAPVEGAEGALRRGWRLFPALADGRNQVTWGAKNLARDTWENGDHETAIQAAGLLFAMGVDARSGALHDALMDGAACLDATGIAIRGALGARSSPSDAFFARMAAKQAKYDDRMKRLYEKQRKAYEDGNYAAWSGAIMESGAALVEGVYAGVRDAFSGSHGGGPPLHLTLGWTPREADEYVHRAWLSSAHAGPAGGHASGPGGAR